MTDARRLLSLRVVALLGLAASAVLTADAFAPGARAFCPLEKACALARSSALGAILGIPTSVLGIVAFFCLLLLSSWTSPRRRAALRAAGLAGAAAGAGFIAFQVFVLHGLCPFCLVADLSAIAAGALVLRWRASTPGRAPAPATLSRLARASWAVAGVLVVGLPLLWPRTQQPSWVALPPGSPSTGPAVVGGPAPAPKIPLVEYLNPFCPHCRATHLRLARVLADLGPPVRRQRLYVWSGGAAAPFWAQACVCAQDQGDLLERAFFRELLAARDDGRPEVLAAARRAGLDIPALEDCVRRGTPRARLESVRQLVLAAKIEGLPTIDFGRRRLEGEQTEGELRTAVEAALADLAAGAFR